MTAASYALLRSLGKCTHCGHRDAMEDPNTGETMCLCGICAESNIDNKAQTKARRLAEGKCPHCGGEPTPGYKTCAAGRDAYARHHKRGAYRPGRIAPLVQILPREHEPKI
jgi:hypothetical protein